MTTKRFRVAVIGAGASGLAAIKCCLDEDMEVRCFEKSKGVGGLWRFTEAPEPGRAGVYRTTTINTSKEMLAYSTFPPPAEFPNFMHHCKLYEYMKMYAERYNLQSCIDFNTDVVSVAKSDNFKETGNWIVKFRQTESQKLQEQIFNAVLVCSGHHAYPNDPSDKIPGRQEFEGRVMHGHDYRYPEPFIRRRVMVVGIGNTGGDLAAELSRHADKLLLSTKRGAWIINRIGDKGIPYDCEFVTRLFHYISQVVPTYVTDWAFESKMNNRFDHELYGIKPNHPLSGQHPLVNDELPARIANGTVTIVPDVKSFRKNGVVTSDGKFHEVDDVIFATGYKIKFPFLPRDVVSVDDGNNISPLYKHVFPTVLSEMPTLAIIGNVQPLGGLMPIAEMQSRWAVRVFKGLTQLPDKVKMEEEVEKRTRSLRQQYVNSSRHTVQVDYVAYMDSIADEIQVKPNLTSLAFSSSRLAWKVLTGPATSYQYRLCGPGKWPGAQEAIEGQWERVLAGFRHRSSLFQTIRPKGTSWRNLSLISVGAKSCVEVRNFALLIPVIAAISAAILLCIAV